MSDPLRDLIGRIEIASTTPPEQQIREMRDTLQNIERQLQEHRKILQEQLEELRTLRKNQPNR